MLVLTSFLTGAHAHTLDSLEGYRLEIGWKDTPPYSGEINAMVLYVSPMIPDLELEEQPFMNGIEDLEDTLKMQLIAQGSKLTLHLEPDPLIPGKYYAYTKITKSGYYQVNLLGTINGTNISLSMHPPQVRNAEHIAFPTNYGITQDVSDLQDALMDISVLESMFQESMHNLTSSYQKDLDEIHRDINAAKPPALLIPLLGVALVLGSGSLVLAAVAYRKS